MMDLDEVDLSQFGAEGYTLNTRLDASGHRDGATDPHLNADLTTQEDVILSQTPEADFRDLIKTQLPGFNGMQNGGE